MGRESIFVYECFKNLLYLFLQPVFSYFCIFMFVKGQKGDKSVDSVIYLCEGKVIICIVVVVTVIPKFSPLKHSLEGVHVYKIEVTL